MVREKRVPETAEQCSGRREPTEVDGPDSGRTGRNPVSSPRTEAAENAMEIEIRSLEPQRVMGIRTPVKLAEIGPTIGRLMPELAGAVGEAMAGPPLARWHAWEGEGGEMELAVPVRGDVAETDRVRASELPGGRAVVHRHVGPYDGLHATWKAVLAEMESRGLRAGAAPWESYVSDPEATPPEEIVTEIVLPLGG
jgi:effector-binding domain-containing protein